MIISVCIPTFNQSSFLEEAIRSAYRQSLLPAEIIVCDDCSTDNTAEILINLKKEISILHVFRQPHNVGISKNVDFCLRMAKGDYVVRLDSDDSLFPNFIEKLSVSFQTWPNAGYAHASVREIGIKGEFRKERRLFRKSGFQDATDALRSALKGYRVAANILMFKREALESVNYLAGRPNFGEDYHLAADMASAGFGNVYIDEILSAYRVWTDIGNIRQKRKLAEISGLRSVFEEVIEPAFKDRNWNVKPVFKHRYRFARQHAICLSYSFYSVEEKVELEKELIKLSPGKKIKLVVWIFKNKLGWVLTIPSGLFASGKDILKKVFASPSKITIS